MGDLQELVTFLAKKPLPYFDPFFMRHKRRKCGRGQWPVNSEQLAVERGHGTWIVERGTWNVDVEHGT